MGATAAVSILAGSAAYQAREGHIARKDASAEKEVAAKKEKELAAQMAAREAEDKAALNRKRFRRLSSGGYGDTILSRTTGGTGTRTAAVTGDVGV